MPKIALDLPKDFVTDLNGSNTGNNKCANPENLLHGASSSHNEGIQSTTKQPMKGKQHVIANDVEEDEERQSARDNERGSAMYLPATQNSYQIPRQK